MAADAQSGGEISRLPTVDIHTHYVPQPFVELLRVNPGWNYAVEPANNGNSSITLSSYLRPEPVLVKAEHREAAVRTARMRDTGVDYQVLSAPTYLFGYHLSGSAAAEFAAAFNDCLSGAVAEEPDRFLGLAILPATDADAAIAEWRRVKDRPGIVGVALGTRVGSSELDSAEIVPILRAVAADDSFILIHPNYVSEPGRQQDFYLTHSFGLPAETALCGLRLIGSGVLDQLPESRLCLAHGGGLLLSALPRAAHIADEIPMAAGLASRGIREYARRFLYDSVVADAVALARLVRQVGADRVLLGSDYPALTGTRDPLALLAAAGLGEASSHAIRAGNAARLLGWPRAT